MAEKKEGKSNATISYVLLIIFCIFSILAYIGSVGEIIYNLRVYPAIATGQIMAVFLIPALIYLFGFHLREKKITEKAFKKGRRVIMAFVIIVLAIPFLLYIGGYFEPAEGPEWRELRLEDMHKSYREGISEHICQTMCAEIEGTEQIEYRALGNYVYCTCLGANDEVLYSGSDTWISIEEE